MNESTKVMIIDDDIELCKIMSMNLTLLGYECSSVVNALEAEGLLKKEPFDLVVCDIIMPSITGLELFEKLNNSFKQLPPFMFYSGLMEAPVSEPYPKGVLGFLSKPFELGTFISLLPERLRPSEELL